MSRKVDTAIKIIGIFWVLLGGMGILNAQNLIPNPSFEDYINCPTHLGNLDQDVAFWDTPTLGSTDYFNGCSEAMGTPKNFNGEQPADFGKGYAGLYLYAPDDYREYLQAALLKPLTKGETYSVSFYVSLAERSDFAVKVFGILLTSKPLAVNTKKNLSKMHLSKEEGINHQFINIPDVQFYRDTEEWMLIRASFTAQGTEKYLILGNFENNTRTRKVKRKKNAKQGAYYYVDLVRLESGNTSKQKLASTDIVDSPPQYALDKIHRFEDVLFEFDEYLLPETALGEVKAVYSYLKEHPGLRITIHGHTDSIGTDHYNELLSGKRCKGVSDYLLQLGLAAERISWEGHGGKKPIAENNTDQGRKKNRRVEFVISTQ